MSHEGRTIAVAEYFFQALETFTVLGPGGFEDRTGIKLNAFKAARARLSGGTSAQMKLHAVIAAIKTLNLAPIKAVVWDEIRDPQVSDYYANEFGIDSEQIPRLGKGVPVSETHEPIPSPPERPHPGSAARPAPQDAASDTEKAPRASASGTAQSESGCETRRTAAAAGGAVDSDGYQQPKQFSVTILGRFYRAAPCFARECLSRLRQTKNLEIKWLGMAMQFGEPFLPDLLERLTESVTECEIRVLIAMLDPKWEAVRAFNPGWPAHAGVNHESLIDLENKFTRSDGTKRVSVTTHLYRYVPNWHGFVIDDSLFFISFCSWRKQRLQGAENLYALIDPGKNAFEKRIATAFSGWFDVAFNQSQFPSGSEVPPW